MEEVWQVWSQSIGELCQDIHMMAYVSFLGNTEERICFKKLKSLFHFNYVFLHLKRFCYPLLKWYNIIENTQTLKQNRQIWSMAVKISGFERSLEKTVTILTLSPLQIVNNIIHPVGLFRNWYINMYMIYRSISV